ncbi:MULTISPECIES: hypothetical protein [Sulfurimonas]|uniref:hypothetical protein n=1 Tax=Sulfurimonas TaxID=202746 RepID=UPI0012659139|nr:hypothetical protein [Sulfurimonas indica]
MEISTSTWMMIAFIIALIFSIWKMYPFLINRTLEDDDTGEDSHNYLIEHMHRVLKDLEETPDEKVLHELMTNHEAFDKERFWRFNLNKLRQLLFRHYGENPHLNSLENIHQEAKERN